MSIAVLASLIASGVGLLTLWQKRRQRLNLPPIFSRWRNRNRKQKGTPTMSLLLTKEQWVSLAKGAAIAAAGAAVTYLTTALGQIDLGQSAPVVTAIAAVAVNFLRKALSLPESK